MSTAPSATAATEEFLEENALGGSAHAVAVNAALRALSRTARSFLIYDASNDAIKQFLADLQSRMNAALRFGAMDLEVRPFELVLLGEVVYMERRRDRSLAFRLFRDGVRRVTVSSGVAWAEVLKLVEILGVRYTGVRQPEDDLVTLLRRAAFPNVAIRSVEGFSQEQDEEEDGVAGGGAVAKGTVARGPATEPFPGDWDLPMADLSGGVPLGYRPVSREELRSIGEDPAEGTAVLALRLIGRLLQAADDPTDPFSLNDVAGLVEEVRDYFVVEGDLDALVALDRVLVRARVDTTALRRSFLDDAVLGRLLRALAGSSKTIPTTLGHWIETLPGDPLSVLLPLCDDSRSLTLGVALIERIAVSQHDALSRRLHQAEGARAALLVGLVLAGAGEKRPALALSLAEHSEPSVRLAALALLTTRSPAVANVVGALLRASEEEVRIAAINHVGTLREASLFNALLHRAEEAPDRLGTAEAEALGRAMALVSPEGALSTFTRWLQPPGLLGRFTRSVKQPRLAWAAVGGLGILPGEEPEKLVRQLQERADDQLKAYCAATLVRRRRTRG